MFAVSIQFQTSENAFVVWRRINTSFLVLLSSLLGSIAGLMAIAGKFMVFVEDNFGKIKNKISRRKLLENIKETRKKLHIEKKQESAKHAQNCNTTMNLT